MQVQELYIAAVSLHQFMGNLFLGEIRHPVTLDDTSLEQEETANGVEHHVTKEIRIKYKQLTDDPHMRDVWFKAMCQNLGNYTRDIVRRDRSKYHTEGMNTMRFVDY